MSYFLANEDGYVADFATNSGLAEFAEWAEKQGGPLADFIERGETEDPAALAGALAKLQTTGDNESIRKALLEAARNSVKILILTDGC